MEYFIKGCRGSGTNYLKKLLEMNFDLFYHELFWKHGIHRGEKAYYDERGTIIFHIYKPVKANLLSLYKYKWHMKHKKNETFKQFCNNKISIYTKNNKILNWLFDKKNITDVYDNPFKMHEIKNNYFKSIADVSIPYIDLLLNPEIYLRKIYEKFKFKRKSDTWITNVKTAFKFDLNTKKEYFSKKLYEIEFEKLYNQS